MDLREVERRYRLGPAFAASWQALWGSDLTELASAPAGSVQRLWADFSLTTNLRGAELALEMAVRLSRGWPSLRGRRTIDVGCGLGGLAVACSRFGAESFGIELDADRLQLARANASDNNSTARFEPGDLLDEGIPGRLGTFDAVTAEDVLEHVAEAEAGVARLAGLVDEGGLVMTTIPNGDAVSFVKADAHYLLPGLTLLDDRSDAEAYFKARFEWGDYGVGDYHAFDDYHSWFEQAGLTVVEVEHISPSSMTELGPDLEAAKSAVAEAAGDATLPGSVRTGLTEGWARYERRVAEYRSMPGPEAERRLTAQFWRIYASKGSVRRRSALWGPKATLTPTLRRWARHVPGAKAVARVLRNAMSGRAGD